jgi:methylmalonyl-CoA mutase N-terminal domain/subunit
VEALTNRMEQEAREYIARIEKLGGVIPAIERGFLQREIADAASRYQREIEQHQRTIVGVNDYVLDEPIRIPLLKMDPQGYQRQCDRLACLRRERDNERVAATLAAVRQAAQGRENLMPYFMDAVNAYATLGEICGVLRQVFGEYREPAMW